MKNTLEDMAIVAFDAPKEVLLAAVYARRDVIGGSALRLHYVKTDETVKAQGPAVVAECAMRWAQEALKDAKARDEFPADITALDVLICAAVGMTDIAEERMI